MDDIAKRIRLPADAGLVRSLGARQSLEVAIADLVDNCLDAGSRHVRVVLDARSHRLESITVVDDGRGMKGEEIDRALTLGGRRDYGATDLGHFGVGLKASSLGQAETLTVWSTASGATPVGRRIRKADFSHDFTCEVLAAEAAAAAALHISEHFGSPTGTAVVWSDLNNTFKGRDTESARTWLHKISLRVKAHLGLTFHRILTAEGLSMSVRIDENGQPGADIPVAPLDPLGYKVSGKSGYPKTLVTQINDHRVALQAHIWPSKSSLVGFRLGSDGIEHQGLFVYRHSRLLQAGGWAQLAVKDGRLRLARVVLDSDTPIPGLTINADKHGVRFSPALAQALGGAAAADGTTFGDFLRDAEQVQVEASRRKRGRKPAVMPGKGLPPSLKRVIKEELPPARKPEMNIRWARVDDDDFLKVDLDGATLSLNERYRRLFVNGRGSLNDAPMLKALLYLLTHEVFEGQYLGSRDKDSLALFNAVLLEALSLEEENSDGD